MRTIGVGIAAVCLGLAGCGDGSGIGPGISGTTPAYENIAGVYSAEVTGVGPDVALTGTMVMTLIQSESTFVGTYEIVGTLDDGGVVGPVTLLGAVNSGTLEAGKNPLLQMNWSPDGCGPLFFSNSGSYASALQQITVAPAEIPVQDAGCLSLVRSVPDTLVFVH